MFAFAGLWDRWRAPDDNVIETCTILTTTPNNLLAEVHDRMLVILPGALDQRWLDPAMQSVAGAIAMLQPYDAHLMRCYPVSTRVNSVTNDSPDCCAPADVEAAPARLFD